MSALQGRVHHQEAAAENGRFSEDSTEHRESGSNLMPLVHVARFKKKRPTRRKAAKKAAAA